MVFIITKGVYYEKNSRKKDSGQNVSSEKTEDKCFDLYRDKKLICPIMVQGLSINGFH